jgi:hypothetical protein
VYLIKREAKELITTIATKYNFEPTKISRVVDVNQKGLNIKVDDDVVRELPEGQDMILEFSRIKAPPVRREWDEGVDRICISSRWELTGVQGVIQSGDYLLRACLL